MQVNEGDWLLIANSSPGDKGDIVSAHATEDDALSALKKCGLHWRVLRIGRAGDVRTPRGVEVVYQKN